MYHIWNTILLLYSTMLIHYLFHFIILYVVFFVEILRNVYASGNRFPIVQKCKFFLKKTSPFYQIVNFVHFFLI